MENIKQLRYFQKKGEEKGEAKKENKIGIKLTD